MNRYLGLALASTALTPLSLAQITTWSQSTDNTTITVGSASCLSNPIGITDNSYWRNYDPVACGVDGDFEVHSVTFAVEDATTTSGSTLITVNLRDGAGFPVGASAARILGTGAISVPDTDVKQQSFHTIAFDPPIFVTAGTHLAIEVMAPNGQPQGDFFFIGSNGLGETPPDSSYISAKECGLFEPIPMGAVGFPFVHMIIDVTVNDLGPRVGLTYCSPAVRNSTGLPAVLSVFGSETVADNVLTVRAEQLPVGEFGYFLASPEQDFMQPPGSNGFMCLGLPCARFNRPGEVIVGPSGSILVDLTSIPVTPRQPVQPGETWNFQCWFRDNDPGQTSNFTDAISVDFR